MLRWERQRGLPVHRLPGGDKGAVLALKSELDAWRLQNETHAGGDDPGTQTPASAPTGAWRATRSWILAMLGVAGLVAVVAWRSWPQASSVPLRFAPLASMPGEEIDPAWSPDGRAIAFSYRPEGESNFDLYVKVVGSGEPLRLTNTPDDERFPQWSPDSRQLAFFRASDCGVWVLGALGGGERRITALRCQGNPAAVRLAWSRTGDGLIVVDSESDGDPPSLYSLELSTGIRSQLTHSPPESVGDGNPALSPAGNLLAFTRHGPTRVSDVWVMNTSGGEPRRITWDARDITGIAWTGDGKDLLVVSDRGGPDPAVWKVPVRGGRPEMVAGLPAYSRMLAVSWPTGRIAYSRFEVRSSIWRYELGAAGARRERLITSSRIQAHPQYSPDGRSIAFMSDRSGFMEIWVAGSDGSNPRKLTNLQGEGGAPRWSPDGTRIAFDMRVRGKHGIFTVTVDGGPVTELIADPFENGSPSWSRDSRWIYFLSNRTGIHQVWKLPALGGSPEPVTHDGGAVAFESPDGSVLYYARGREGPGLWKKTLADGAEVPVLPDYAWASLGAWQVGRRGIYFLDKGEKAEVNSAVLKLLPRTGGPPRVLEVLGEAAYPFSYVGDVTLYHPLSISPDGKYSLFARLDHRHSNIMIAEGSPSAGLDRSKATGPRQTAGVRRTGDPLIPVNGGRRNSQ